MSRKFTIAAVAVAFALSMTPAWAGQGKPQSGSSGQAGSRPSNGQGSGTAVPRGGGGGGNSGGSTSSSAGSSSAGTSSSGSSGSSGSYAAPRGGGSSSYEAPQRPRSNGGEHRGSGQTATPRSSSGSGERGAVRTGGSTTSTASSGNNNASGRDRVAVPPYSRPRNGSTVQGTAVERTTPIDRGRRVFYPGVFSYPGSIYYDPYYSYGRGRYSSFWSPYGYGYGFGYFAYDPFLFGADPAYGYGGYGYGGGYDDPQMSGYGYGRSYETGSVRLKVKPNNAQVFIDGYYVGLVDSFDGVFQRLGIESGAHKVEIKAEGYEPVQFEVMVTPGETVTYKGELKRIH